MRFLFKLVFILIIGAAGGILGTQLLLPYLSSKPYFEKYDFIRESSRGTTIINKQEQVFVKENEQLEKVVEKAGLSVLFVQSKKAGKIVFQGSGMIITGDGLALTLNPSASTPGQEYAVMRNDTLLAAEVMMEDPQTNFVLLKIEETNLPVVFFGPEELPALGERVILLGAGAQENRAVKFMNTGVVNARGESGFSLNFREERRSATGSPLLNIKGEVIGVNIIDKTGNIATAPIVKIKEFLGKVF